MIFAGDIGRIRLLQIAALVVAIGAAFSFPLHAEDFAGDVPDLVWIDLGGAYNNISTQIAVVTPNGVGAAFDFEDVFDIPGREIAGRMFGTVRISPKRRYIDFGYVDIRRSGTRVLEEDVQFGDYLFQTGSNVTAKFDTGFIYAAFRYDFLHLEPIRVSGSAGITYLNLGVGLAGVASYPDPNDPNAPPLSSDVDQHESLGAPVPMVGLNMDWALARRLILRAYSRFFRINISSVDGGLFESGIRLNWYFARHFGLGVGYDRTDLQIDQVTLSNGDVGQFDYTITGAGLYINLAF
jgi:hypothetical protein